MLINLTVNILVYLVTGYTDIRKSIDGLAVIVQGNLHLDPFSKALFLFCGKRCDRLKGLLEGLTIEQPKAIKNGNLGLLY